MTKHRYPRFVAGLVLAVALSVVMPLATESPALAAPGWNSETLDTGVSTGEGISTIYWPPFAQHHVFNSGTVASNPVLRHGWFQPGYPTWSFETLDTGTSTGRASATGLWAYQHHVFNEGRETGTPVLRHGWYQDGQGTWAFETLDGGNSTGTDTAYADYGGQQHVFSHGVGSTGADIVRHGYYEPGVGSWKFETLDEGASGGTGISTMVWRNQLHYFNLLAGTFQGLRHGWYEPGAGWKFETLVQAVQVESNGLTPSMTPPMRTAAQASSNDRQSVFYTSIDACGSCASPYWQGHGWFDLEGGSWNFDLLPSVMVGPLTASQPDGRRASVTEAEGRTEVFAFGIHNWSSCDGIYHAVWDGGQWWPEILNAPCTGNLDTDMVRYPTAAGTYPPFSQLHTFYAQDPPALGHIWRNPA